MVTAEQQTVSISEYNRLKAIVERMEADKAKKQRITFKVGEKGGVSLYGLGRFPVTLYAGQWDRLLAAADDLKAFMATNRSKLAVKE